MRLPCFALLSLALGAVSCSTVSHKSAIGETSLSDFQQRATRWHSIVSIPPFETNTNEVSATIKQTIATGDAALDRIGKLSPADVTFTNTVVGLDDMSFGFNEPMNRLYLIGQTSTNADVRDACIDACKQLEDWAVGLDYREEVYHAVRTYAATQPHLEGEDAKLLTEVLRDYRRAGLDLPKADRDQVEAWRKQLSDLSTDFEDNVTKATNSITFTAAELAGLTADFLSQIKTGPDAYTVQDNITWQYITVMDNAAREDTRKKVFIAEENLARDPNVPLLEKILVLRDNIATKLGYQNWADFQIEVKMAKDGKTATKFLEDLKTGLQPKFDAELEEFRQLKIKETGNTNAIINVWDWRYFANELKKQKYDIDDEVLRVYFPYQQVLDGMFAIYQRIFGLKFQRVQPPYKWVDDLQLYAVSDAKTGQPLGLFYLDMFPREGKYNHFAEFGIIDGKLLPDGTYQRPTVCLVCNFPQATKDHPPLMSHDDVVTIFHEFGHAMHAILTEAKYYRFSGTSVPGDFVEAPSQMLENWPWDKRVLDSFAADYRDPSKKIPTNILAQLKAAKLATEGTRYRRQLAFALLDMALHTQIHATNADQTVPLSNQVLSDVFLPQPTNTAFVAYFGHLIGYDAGYYGYAWADAIAADMATVFQNAPDGYFDRGAGMRLRKEIYEMGDSRDVNISIEKFLGRPRSIKPFLKRTGIATN